MKKSYAISFIRALATAMIIACHIFQYLNMELAWWFNVGVQIFLCISGYLYGSKSIEDDFAFIVKQYGKILLDYWIVIIPATLLYLFFNISDSMSASEVIGLLVGYSTLPGAGHLWYVATCLFCYALTPLIRSFFLYAEKGSTLRMIFLSIVGMAVIQLLCGFFVPYFNGAWINCYFIGFFLKRMTLRGPKLDALFAKITYAVAIFLNAGQIYIDYLNPTAKELLPGCIVAEYGVFCNYAHVALGVAIFLVVYALLARREGRLGNRMTWLLDGSDRYSYDIYLVHQFFILGPASLMTITPLLVVNIGCVLVATLLCAKLVNMISCLIRGRAIPAFKH